MMRAAVYSRYGPPEVVTIEQVNQPSPNDNELLVKVYASTINRTDCGFRSAEYFISRFWSGLFKPKIQTLGCEFTGIVESTGKSVKLFKAGDRVVGYNDQTFGGHAEYLVIAEDACVVTMPDDKTFEELAPMTEGAHYALSGIRAAKVKAGDHVLVYGATGAIGSAAVQLLRHFGAHITAVSNTKNVELVRSLGAHHVIDYQQEDFTRTEQRFSFILDAVGKSSFGQCKPLLKNKGIYISTELGKGSQNIFLALFTPLLGGKKLLFPIPVSKKSDVEFLKALAERGEFRPVIDRVYPFESIVEAYQYVETRQKTGNVVLRIATSL